MKRIAVLMTCYNRKEKTLECLDILEKQVGISDINLSIYLVDDGSTDGTSEAVSNKYPFVNILEGDGSLYWGGGMHKAMEAAKEFDYDFYLWLNDDVKLYQDAIQSLFETYYNLIEKGYSTPIVGGSFLDPDSKETTYGGRVRKSRWRPLGFKILEPGNVPQRCDVLNGNLVLIHENVRKQVGNLHPDLQHTEGDFEYCLRAENKGFNCWIAAGYQGECSRNSIDGTWQDTSLSLSKRYEKLLGTKGHPFHSRYIYMSNYGGRLWPIFYIWIYIRPLLDHIKKYIKIKRSR